MIESLEARLEERKTQYETVCKRERQAEALLSNFPDIEFAHLSTYADSIHMVVREKDVFKIELEIVPEISRVFGRGWNKNIDEYDITWRKYFYLGGTCVTLSIITPVKGGVCQVRKIPTGEYEEVAEMVTRPKFEYVIDCGE